MPVSMIFRKVLKSAGQRQFALKKIRCPTGSEGVAVAMREVEAYRRFKCESPFIHGCDVFLNLEIRHPNIIRILVDTPLELLVCHSCSFPVQDSAVVQDPEGEGKIVYLFLPLYKGCSTSRSFSLTYAPSPPERQPAR